jgi:hypothetical protein
MALAAIGGEAAAETAQGRRLALVIGNGAYTFAGPLANPASDAAVMGKTLAGLGFTVISGTDLDRKQFDAKVREFILAMSAADTALFYYAGHGLQIAGRNYLLPVEAKIDDEDDVRKQAILVDDVLQYMELNRSERTNLVILDACRNNPFERQLRRAMGDRSVALGSGLAPIDAGAGTFIAFSTAPGSTAKDGIGLSNSPFTASLARHIRTPGNGVSAVMINVRKDVIKATGGEQVPWDHSALTGDFYFAPGGNAAIAAPAPEPRPDAVAALPRPAEPATVGTARGMDCVVVSRSLDAPVAVKPGMTFCEAGGGMRATVHEIRSYGVVYSTEGRRKVTCKPGQTCSFDWTGAPLFTSRVSEDASGIAGSFIPSR